MGNGAPLNASSDAARADAKLKFAQLEKQCLKGYFRDQDNFLEYLAALEEAINSGALDYLELLIGSGNVKKALPVHIACELGKVEPLELFLSAGLPGDSLDKNKQNPLHKVGGCYKEEASLCAILLCIQFPLSLKHYDSKGNMPVHIAAQMNNVEVLKVFLQQKGIDASTRNKQGKSVLAIAREYGSVDAIDLLTRGISDQYSGSNLRSAEGAAHANSSHKKSLKKMSKIEQDINNARIMAVWEKFFENAFLRAGVSLDEEEFADIQPTTKEKRSKSKKKSNKLDNHQSYSKHSYDEFNSMDMVSANNEYVDWFRWILCFDCEEATRDPYFVLNTQSLTKVWLDLFIAQLNTSGDYWFLSESPETIRDWPLPSSLAEVTSFGWMSFYNIELNASYWMNVVSGNVETYLPLGLNETQDSLSMYGLYTSVEDSSMVEANQTCSLSWLLVIAATDTGDSIYYYMNTVTGETKWNPPTNWDSTVSDYWNGWTLCCSEERLDETFWYDFSSGESRW